jgi:hypothetical protein
MLLTSLAFMSVAWRAVSVVSATPLVFGRGSDYVPAMSDSPALAHSRPSPRRKPLGRLRPYGQSSSARWRFFQDRLEGYTRRVGGPPNEHQAALIEEMIEVEWSGLQFKRRADEAYARAEAATDRVARTIAIREAQEETRLQDEQKRRHDRLDYRLEKSIATTSPRAPRARGLKEHLAARDGQGP